MLRGRRFRLRAGGGWVAAEKGYLHEAGNLLFHVALLALLAAVGLGAAFGYKADRLLVEGDSFANTVSSLDAYHPGRFAAPSDLRPFTIGLDRFRASYLVAGPMAGQPASFAASIRYAAEPGGPPHRYGLQVNRPLEVDGAKVYLIGHGYAPVFKVTDGTGRVAFDQAVPFIPADKKNFTSQGVIKVPDARPRQLGFTGVFAPTAVAVGGRLGSAFPAPLNPVALLVPYAGDLGLGSGVPQSVYSLNTAGMRRLPAAPRPRNGARAAPRLGTAGAECPWGAGRRTRTGVPYRPGSSIWRRRCSGRRASDVVQDGSAWTGPHLRALRDGPGRVRHTGPVARVGAVRGAARAWVWRDAAGPA